MTKSPLFTPLELRSVTLPNRIGMSPMCQYSAKDGLANDWHLVHLGSRAAGGVGLVMVEATAVSPIGRISPADLGLWNESQVEPLRRITRFLTTHGTIPGIQLAHAGRKASTDLPWHGGRPLSPTSGGWTPVGPSAIRFDDGYPVPEELHQTELARIAHEFEAAAGRAMEAGFRWIEVHAAHGYLLHSFHSPLSNRRTDAYGGPLQNRVRFTAEIVTRVRRVITHETPLSVRLSCTDWSLQDSVIAAGILKEAGADLIDCSSGGSTPHASIPASPGYQVPFAERIRAEAKIPTAAVGMITTPSQAEEIISEGKADVVLLGRALLRDPAWAIHAARSLGHEGLQVPNQYLRMA